jgi:hypothetical protein
MAQDVVELDGPSEDRQGARARVLDGRQHPRSVAGDASNGSSRRPSADRGFRKRIQPAQVPKDPDPPASNDPNVPRGESWSPVPGYDRVALDAVQKYPWKPEDRAIGLTRITLVTLSALALLGHGLAVSPMAPARAQTTNRWSEVDPSATWPRFRGPASNPIAHHHPNLPVRWSKTENVEWVATGRASGGRRQSCGCAIARCRRTSSSAWCSTATTSRAARGSGNARSTRAEPVIGQLTFSPLGKNHCQ